MISKNFNLKSGRKCVSVLQKAHRSTRMNNACERSTRNFPFPFDLKNDQINFTFTKDTTALS